MGDKGINNTEDIHIKWPELMRFKHSIVTIVAIIMLWNILDMIWQLLAIQYLLILCPL